MLRSIIEIICVVAFVIVEYMHYKERKDLYNRIMSRSVDDYKVFQTKDEPKKGEEVSYLEKIRQENEWGE